MGAGIKQQGLLAATKSLVHNWSSNLIQILRITVRIYEKKNEYHIPTRM